MPHFDSSQEADCYEYIRQTAGAAGCFVPDNYRRGSSEKEAADLAWSGLGWVVLFYAQRSATRSAEEQNRHNFEKGAKPWLRAWRNGARLKGRNRLQEFDIGATDARHLVVISVVAAADAKVVLQQAYARDLGVTAAATLPEHEFAQMAAHGWTLVDLIYHLNAVRLQRVSWQPGFVASASSTIARRVQFANPSWASLSPYLVELAKGVFAGIRSPTDGIVRIAERLHPQVLVSLATADFTFGESWGLIRTIAAALHQAAPGPRGLGRGYAEIQLHLERAALTVQAFTQENIGFAALRVPEQPSVEANHAFAFRISLAIEATPALNRITIHPRYSFARGVAQFAAEAFLDEIRTGAGLRVDALRDPFVGQPRTGNVGEASEEERTHRSPRPRRHGER